MRRYITQYIEKLNNKEKIKRETLNLLIQSKLTLKNVYKLIKNKSVADANALIRSCFENIMMAMLISYDDNTYKEFINLSIKYNDRKYTKPYQIRENFGLLLKKLENELFEEIPNGQLKKVLDDFYEELCSFSHSTLMINVVVELEKDENLDLYIAELKQNACFLEFLLYLCLKHLCKSQKKPLDITYMVLGFYVSLSNIPKEKITSEHIERIYSLMHAEENKEYLEKNKDKNEFIINEANKLRKEIEENPLGIINLLKEYIK